MASPISIEGIRGRSADLGEGTAVRRLLPTRGRRLVGPWCFLDHYGPEEVRGPGMSVGPHPHIGIQTVSWLLEGEILHRDSLGSEQLIRPGQLNLMTSGRGIAHAEETPASHSPRLHGVQLWVALPESARHGAPAFQHVADLPEAGFGPVKATALIGALGGGESAAKVHSPMVGAELLALKAGDARIPLDPAFEHALALLEGRAASGGSALQTGFIYPLAPGSAFLDLNVDQGARLMLLGGTPFPEPILMWWNFVGRKPEELTEARADWEQGRRFGAVPSPLPRIPAPGLDPGMLRLRR